jgi:hypothetical protein
MGFETGKGSPIPSLQDFPSDGEEIEIKQK